MSIPLDALRRTSLLFLPQRCSVQRYTETNTPDGVEHAWTNIASGVPCRVSPRARTALERAAEGVERAVSEWTVWLPAGTDVTVRDRLAIDPPDGRTFEAERVGTRSYEVAREILAVLVA